MRHKLTFVMALVPTFLLATPHLVQAQETSTTDEAVTNDAIDTDQDTDTATSQAADSTVQSADDSVASSSEFVVTSDSSAATDNAQDATTEDTDSNASAESAMSTATSADPFDSTQAFGISYASSESEITQTQAITTSQAPLITSSTDQVITETVDPQITPPSVKPAPKKAVVIKTRKIKVASPLNYAIRTTHRPNNAASKRLVALRKNLSHLRVTNVKPTVKHVNRIKQDPVLVLNRVTLNNLKGKVVRARQTQLIKLDGITFAVGNLTQLHK